MEVRRGPSRATVRRRRAVALIAVAVAIALVVAIAGRGDDGESPSERAAREAAAMPVPAEVVSLVDSLEGEQLAEQVLLLGVEGTAVDSELEAELERRQLGGILVGADNWLDADQGAALVESLRKASGGDGRIPPLVVTDQEGGDHRSLADLPPAETQLEVGDTGDPLAAEAWATETAEALADVGFDLNLFPLADVASLPSPLADRSFSDDPAVAAALTAAAIRGCREAGLGCAPAHFPGLGGASQDPAQGPATVGLDAKALSARDLQAFAAGFDAGAPAVVLSHALYSTYDPVTPGALTPAIATDLLRSELGYEGAAITDDLGVGSVRSLYSAREAAVRALTAGADLVQIEQPGQQRGVVEAIMAAVASGELSEARLRQAAGRVLALKRELGLIE